MQLLTAYESVLARHGLLAAEDSHFYRMVLSLSVMPGSGWWPKFRALRLRHQG